MGVRWARPERANCSRAHEPPRRAPVLAHTAGPCHALPASPLHDSPPWRPTAPPPEHFWRHAGVGRQPCAVQRRPSHSRSPPGPWNSACSSAAMSASARRRHDALLLQNVGSPERLSTAAVEPTSSRYKWTPRAPLSTHATSCYPHGAPLPRIRPGEVFFIISGNSCRRHRPGQSARSSQTPATIAGAPLRSDRGGRRRAATGQT